MRIRSSLMLCLMALPMTLGCVGLRTLPSPMVVEVPRESPDYTMAPSPPIVEVQRSTGGYRMAPSPPIAEVPRTAAGTSTPQEPTETVSGDPTPGVILEALYPNGTNSREPVRDGHPQ
jgi:hypothetical protein